MSQEDDELERKKAEESRWREENQRNIDFIIRQQAQFTADMQRLGESQARAEQRWERSEQRWERTEESIRALRAIAEIHDGEIKALAQTQAEAQARTDRQMSETDERLNALVNVVERIISERRNGGTGAG
jgi:predicted  nucleic acid-binding Zn-ribbon protein